MERSPAVAEAVAASFRNNASGDPSTFDDVVSTDDAVLVIGSAAHEWFAGQLHAFYPVPDEIALHHPEWWSATP